MKIEIEIKSKEVTLDVLAQALYASLLAVVNERVREVLPIVPNKIIVVPNRLVNLVCDDKVLNVELET